MRTKASRHSHILVPDGLTARLMRTTRIRPWPIGTVWSPANLFPTGTEEGLFLDFSDISTLYTDQTFATNISAIGDPVGGVLDKSQGLVLGAGKLTNGGFDTDLTGWTAAAGFSVSGGKLIGATVGDKIFQDAGITAGEVYSFTITGVVGEWGVRLGQDISNDYTITADGTYFITPGASYSTTDFRLRVNTAGSELASISVKKLSGNHLIQATATARPIWTRHPKSGVRNLLDYSEDFSAPGEWVGVVATLTTGVADPLGGNTAIRVTPTGALGYIATSNTGASVSQVMMSAWLRSADGSPMTLHFRTAGAIGSAKSVTGTWQRFDELIAGTALDFRVQNRTDTRAFEIAFCQVEEGSSPTPYQTRVNQYNVTEAGVDDCYGLTFDGVDDYMVTAANLDLSGTMKITATVGMFKGDETSTGIVFGRGTFGTVGDYGIAAPGSAGTHDYYYQFRMSTGARMNSTGDGLFDAPSTNVVTGGNDSGGVGLVRVDGVTYSNTLSGMDVAYPSDVLYFGATNNSGAPSLYFTGTLYGVTLTDYILDAEQLAALETWTAARTPEVTLAVPSDFYVDSVSGSDSNSGKFDDAAFQTLGAAETAALAYGDGANVFLLAGSEWEEQLDLSVANAKLTTHGTGAIPTISGADVVTGWTAEGTANVYQAAVAHDGTGSSRLTVYEDGVLLERVANIATCSSTPGSFVDQRASLDASPWNVLIHPTGSGNPTSNGSIYEVSARMTALRVGDGGTATGPVEVSRALSNNGPLVAGLNANVSQVLSVYGTKHNVFWESGTLSDVIACRADRTTSYEPSSTYFVAYSLDADGLNAAMVRCGVSHDRTGTMLPSVLTMHDSTGNVYNSFTGTQLWCVDTGGFAPSAVTCSIDGLYGLRVTELAAGWYADTATISRAMLNQSAVVTLPAISTLYGATAGGATSRSMTIENTAIYSVNSNTAVLRMGSALDGLDLTLRNCVIYIDVGYRAIWQTSGGVWSSGSLTVENCIIVAEQFTSLLDVPSGITYTGDSNVFVCRNHATRLSLKNAGTDYSTLAAWRSATGQDANSIYVGSDTLATLFSGSVSGGDFRLGGTGAGASAAAIGAGCVSHWDWTARAAASGAPSSWPTVPTTLAESRTYIADPTAWSF